MRISLLQSLSIDTSRMETTDPIWLIGSTFQPRRIPSFFRENHFPFFASGPRNAGKEASSLNALPFPSFPRCRHTRHVCPGTSRRTYVPLMKNPVTMAEGLEIPIRISGVPLRRLRRYRIYPVRETRNFGREILHLVRLPYLPYLSAHRRRKWGSRWYFTWLSIWRIHDYIILLIDFSQSSPVLNCLEQDYQ